MFCSYLNGWVATGVEDLSGLDTGDGRHLKRRRRSGDVGVERRASECVGGACSDVSVEEINTVRERNICGVNKSNRIATADSRPIRLRRRKISTIEDVSSIFFLRRGREQPKTLTDESEEGC